MSATQRSFRRNMAGAALRRAGLGRGEWIAFALLAALALAPFAALIVTADSGDSLTGADGFQPADQLMYMAWAREMGEHVLASNPFDLAPSEHVYFQPLLLLSGLAWKLGLPIALAFQLWLVPALVVLFGGTLAYARRFLPGDGRAQLLALAIALAGYSPLVPLAFALGASDADREDLHFLAFELFPLGQLWGYLPAALTFGLVPIFMLGLERLLTNPGRGRAAALAAVGMAVAFLHPWQGLVLLIVMTVAVGWSRSLRTVPRLLVPGAATLAPLVYYYLLSASDPAWATGRAQSGFFESAPWALPVAALPLALLATLGIRRRGWSLGEVLLAGWIGAALFEYFFLQPTYEIHALGGLSVPLAVLAVRGLTRLGGLRLTAAVATILVVPGLVFAFVRLGDWMDAFPEAYALSEGERAALRYIERSESPGGVVASPQLGALVPAYTGRKSWVGHPTWTPAWPQRAAQAERLLAGRMSPGGPVRFLRHAGPRFVLSDCRRRRDLSAELRPILAGVRRFGCATVYELRR